MANYLARNYLVVSLYVCIWYTGFTLQELAKDKPVERTLDKHTNGFMQTLDEVETELATQISYLSQVCNTFLLFHLIVPLFKSPILLHSHIPELRNYWYYIITSLLRYNFFPFRPSCGNVRVNQILLFKSSNNCLVSGMHSVKYSLNVHTCVTFLKSVLQYMQPWLDSQLSYGM